jgi:hypothetical protein
MRIKILITAIFCLITTFSFAQYDGYNYQGVARNNSGNVLSNQPVSIRISILDGSVSGISEYIETHNITTNQFGLFTVVVGRGIVVSGTFVNVTWNNAKFMKVEMDATGGTNYNFMGTNELLMVPYAKYAETAGSGSGNGTIYTAGNGITVNNTTNKIINSKPDQTVSLTGSGSVTVTGTYPSFDINSSGTGGSVYTAGNGITVNNTTNKIINSKPDQTVALNAGSNVTITGTYPNFTIAASGGGTYTGGNGINVSGTIISIPNNGLSNSMIPNNTITTSKLNFTPLTNPFSGTFTASGNIIAGNPSSSSSSSGDIVADDDLIADDNLLVGDDAEIMDNLYVPNGFLEVGNFSGNTSDGGLFSELVGTDGLAVAGAAAITGDLLVLGNAFKPGGGSWSSSSDRRLKDIHQDYERGLTEIAAINPLFYNYKADNPKNIPSDKIYIGIVAQELQKFIPEAVTVDEDGYLVVNNDPVIWAMVNAIQELEQKNKDLEAAEKKIEDLEKRLVALEELIKQ